MSLRFVSKCFPVARIVWEAFLAEKIEKLCYPVHNKYILRTYIIIRTYSVRLIIRRDYPLFGLHLKSKSFFLVHTGKKPYNNTRLLEGINFLSDDQESLIHSAEKIR